MAWQTRMRVREESRTSVGRILGIPDVPDRPVPEWATVSSPGKSPSRIQAGACGELPDAPIQITIFFRLFALFSIVYIERLFTQKLLCL